MDTATARQRLEETLAELDRSAATLQSEGGPTGELTVVDQHQADSATDLSDADREEAVLGVVQSQRDEVLAALKRIDEGTYGTCAECGQQLPDERLEAKPAATRCVTCQQRYEGGR